MLIHQILATVSCNLAAVVTGSSFAWMGPLAIPLTSEDSEVKMTLTDFSWITSIAQFGYLLFVIPSGVLADRYGRKTVLITIAPLSILSWLLTAFTRSVMVLYLVRFVQGIIIAIAFTVAPMYVAEVAGPKVRGSLGSHFSTMLYVGTVFSYFCGSYFKYQTYIYSLMSLPVIYLVMFIFMPESPYYLFMVKRNDKAYESYNWLSGDHNNVELMKIEKAVKEDMNQKGGWKDLIATKSDIKSLLIVQLVVITRSFTGLPAYSSYGTQVFAASSKNIFNAQQLAVLMIVIFTISSFLSSNFSDMAGRRRLMILSCSGTIISNFATFLYFLIEKYTSLDVSIWFLYTTVLVFSITTNTGIAQLMMVLQAEFFPSNTRGKGSAVSGITSASSTFLVLILFQTFTDTFGIYMNFLFYSISTLVCIILIHHYVPESSGKTLAEVNSVVKDEKLEMLSSEKA